MKPPLRAERSRLYLPLQILLPLVLFLFLAGNNLVEFFGGDDVMNLYQYLKSPLGYWASGIAHFWSSAWYRPLGGIVYLILFRTFGLHPLPFKIVLFAILVFNMALFLYVASKVVSSLQIATFALLFCAYHAALNGLYLDFGTIYDVLGYSFFFGALAIYIAWVAIPRYPAAGSIIVVVLYILGLCCKEIVVTLPGVLLLYSLLMTDAVARDRARWLLRGGSSIVICFGLGLWYTIGKMSGPDSLTNDPRYAPHVNLHQWALSTSYYMRQLFYLHGALPTPTAAIWILVGMIVIALLLRSNMMLFSAGAIVLTQLPISLIAPRNGFVLYIAVGFWALYLATLLNAGFPLNRRPAWSFGAYVALAATLCTVHLRMKPVYDKPYTLQTRAYQDLAAHLEQWNFRLPRNGKVLLVNDPFLQDWVPWDSLFLISLAAHTTDATVTRLKFNPVMVPLSEVDAYDYVIDYDSTWRLLKEPGRPLINRARLQSVADAAPIQLLDGFALPTADNWRNTRPTFTMRVKPTAEPSLAYIHLRAMTPGRVSISLDGGTAFDQTARQPGDVNFLVPIRADLGHAHTLSFQVSSEPAGTPVILFMYAEVRRSS